MRIPKEALIAQLDRVQVSEACGVGSSPAERTNFKKLNSKIEKTGSFHFYTLWVYISGVVSFRLILHYFVFHSALNICSYSALSNDLPDSAGQFN